MLLLRGMKFYTIMNLQDPAIAHLIFANRILYVEGHCAEIEQVCAFTDWTGNVVEL